MVVVQGKTNKARLFLTDNYNFILWSYAFFKCISYDTFSYYLIVLLHILEDIHWIFFISNVRDLARQWYDGGLFNVVCEEILH